MLGVVSPVDQRVEVEVFEFIDLTNIPDEVVTTTLFPSMKR